MTAVLKTIDLSAGYAGHAVVRNLNFEVHPGEVVALLGPNGAGKSTTLLTLAGALPKIDGEVRFEGRATTAPLHRRARDGMSFVTEERSVFPGLTVAENLRVGRCTAEHAVGMFPELIPLMRRAGGLLSGGEQQMLTLARALARSPRLLLADELSLGLAPLIVRRLLRAVREAADTDGVGVLLVEQHARQALDFADRAYVLRRGEVVLSGTAADIKGSLGDVQRSYLADDEPTPTTRRSKITTLETTQEEL